MKCSVLPLSAKKSISPCNGRIPDGTITPLTMPNHNIIKASTLRSICTQARIPREDFLSAFEKA